MNRDLAVRNASNQRQDLMMAAIRNLLKQAGVRARTEHAAEGVKAHKRPADLTVMESELQEDGLLFDLAGSTLTCAGHRQAIMSCIRG